MKKQESPGFSRGEQVNDIGDLLAGVFARHQIGAPSLCLCTYSGTPCTSLELARALRSERERVEAVRALHKPEKRWQHHKDHDASYDSREEVLEDWCECDGGCACKPTYFEVCVECGSIESGDDPWLYRESLWPCPTARALGDGGE